MDIKQYLTEENKIGKGGNGTVYRISDDKVVKVLNLNYNSKKLSKRDEKKYIRFKDEIKIVKKNQNKNNGILPILEYNIPETPQKDDIVYYIMPYAQQINDIKFPNLESIISFTIDLLDTLLELHKNNIVHRDIKPQNIYRYKNRFVLSDFGLVDYPNKEEITQTRESVGPWTTMAPEMKRNAKYSDAKPADIYSLAKTFWIILSGDEKSFDGEYTYLSELISIKNFTNEEDFIVPLHDFLEKCTSNDPLIRFTAKGAKDLLFNWINIKDNYSERSKYEWDFLLKQITSIKPESIKWNEIDSINEILNILGKIHTFNHMFLPNGGGMDFHGSKILSNRKYLALDEKLYTRIVKPVRLQFNYHQDSQWSHFFLETDVIHLENIDEIPEERISDIYLQLDDDTYVEHYYKNYDEYKGEKIPEHAEIVTVSHSGNYVIFPKDSIYNNALNSYGGIHEKFINGDIFNQAILNTQRKIVDIENNPEKYELIQKKSDTEQKEDRHISFLKRKSEEERIIEEIDRIDILSCVKQIESNIPNSAPFKFYFYYCFGIDTYVLNKKFKFQKYKTSYNLDEMCKAALNPKEFNNQDEYLEFHNFKSIIELRDRIINLLTDNIKTLDEYNRFQFFAKSKRIKQIEDPIFTMKELKLILASGIDTERSHLVINISGKLQLIPHKKFENTDHAIFSSVLHDFDHHQNILGNGSEKRRNEFVEYYYSDFLYSLMIHLKSGKTTEHAENESNIKVDEIKKRIIEYNDKYPA